MKYPRMTEPQYVEWCDSDTFAEWVNGKVIDVSRTNVTHALLSSFLLHLVRAYIEKFDLGTVLRMPYQIRLASQRCRRMPDLMFVSHKRQIILTDNHAQGPPDMVCEILTTESRLRDRRDKFNDYQNAGVCEYWIIDPTLQAFEMFRPSARIGGYELIAPDKEGRIKSKAISGFYLRPTWLWQQKLPNVPDLLKEMSSKR